jgi:hypothetical protein
MFVIDSTRFGAVCVELARSLLQASCSKPHLMSLQLFSEDKTQPDFIMALRVIPQQCAQFSSKLIGSCINGMINQDVNAQSIGYLGKALKLYALADISWNHQCALKSLYTTQAMFYICA